MKKTVALDYASFFPKKHTIMNLFNVTMITFFENGFIKYPIVDYSIHDHQ
jgi:hypothetical protein